MRREVRRMPAGVKYADSNKMSEVAAVTPLAAMNDTGGAVTVVLDAALAVAALVNVHPLRNTATVALSGADLCRALDRWAHPAAISAIPERA